MAAKGRKPKTSTPEGQYVSTTAVAASLGVSVSTVKRWVEDGVLPAQKTAGGHRKLLLADVRELARNNNLPLTQPTVGQPVKKQLTAPDSGALSSALHRALLEGNAENVRQVVQESYRATNAMGVFADSVIAPAMHRIGKDWETGKIDVLHEHRATQLCIGALHELRLAVEVQARRERPIAVGGALEGDYSELPTLLSQMVLIEAGWNAVNLGANTPLASFRRALDEMRPKLVWVSVSHVADEKRFPGQYNPFYRHAERLGVPVVVGGRGLTESLRSKIPYTAYGDGLSNLAAFARTVLPPPRRPRRGRPPEN